MLSGGEPSAPRLPVTRLRLSFRASKLPCSGILSKSLPNAFASVFLFPKIPFFDKAVCEKDDGGTAAILLGSTEVVNKCAHPRWTRVFFVDYEYGSDLTLVIEIFDGNKKSFGKAFFGVGDIFGSTNKTKAKRLPKGGCIYAHMATCVSLNSLHPDAIHGTIRFQLCAVALLGYRCGFTGSEPDTFFEVSRQNQASDGFTWDTVYRSSPVIECLHPTWDPVEMDLATFCNCEQDLPLLFSIFAKKKRSKPNLVGTFETNARNLIAMGRKLDEESSLDNVFILSEGKNGSNLNHSYSEVGRIIVKGATILKSVGNEEDEAYPIAMELQEEGGASVDNFDSLNIAPLRPNIASSVIPVPNEQPASLPTFQECIDAGSEIDFCVGIDFTSSNGDPRIPGTLHYSSEISLNDYEETVVGIGNAISVYSSSQEFPVWGFGAKYGGQIRHIFQCGPTGTAKGVEGIIDHYRSVFRTDLIMSGPTDICQVIQAAAARAQNFHSNSRNEKMMKYSVLLILTDGIVYNSEATKALLHKCAKLPLSIIIVGMGRADFSAMQGLERAAPKNLTFLPFRSHQHDPHSLTRAALRNFPDQFVEYFLANDMYP